MTLSTPTPVASPAPLTSLEQVFTRKRPFLRLLYKLKSKFSQKLTRGGGVILDDWTGGKLRAAAPSKPEAGGGLIDDWTGEKFRAVIDGAAPGTN